MKNFILLFVLICLASIETKAQSINWTLVNTGTTKHIRDISFISKDTGIIAGDDGLLKYTTDGGTTWADMIFPSTGQAIGNNNNVKVAQIFSNVGYINGVLFFDKFTAINRMYGWDTGWMEECGGSVFSMNDSVCSINNFHQTNPVYDGYTAGSSCLESGGVVGYFGGFCFTFDSLINDTSFHGWMDVTSNINGNIVLVGEDGYYAYSSGGTYNVLNSGNGYNYLSTDWSGTSTVYAINDSFGWSLEMSTNGGNTFVIDSTWVNTFYYPQIAEMDFTDNDWGVMAGISNGVYGIIVTKRGSSYDFFQTDTNLTSAFVLDSTFAFAGGLNGKLYKYDQLANMGTDPVIENIDFSIFPNPQYAANDVLNLFFEDEVNEMVIFDMMGKAVFNQKINKQGNISVNTGIKTAGTYIVRVFTDKGVGTKKYVLN